MLLQNFFKLECILTNGKCFFFLTGEVIQKPSWGKDQPNNYNGEQNCVVLDGGRGWLWNDVGCNLDYLHWICQSSEFSLRYFKRFCFYFSFEFLKNSIFSSLSFYLFIYLDNIHGFFFVSYNFVLLIFLLFVYYIFYLFI